MNKHNKNVLIAFGTSNMPPESLCEVLVNSILEMNEKQKEYDNSIGYIISAKNIDYGTHKIDSYDYLENLINKNNLDNILLKTYVPQN